MKDRSDHVNDLGHNRAWGRMVPPPRQGSWRFSRGESTNHRSHSPLLSLGLKVSAASNFAMGNYRALLSRFPWRTDSRWHAIRTMYGYWIL